MYVYIFAAITTPSYQNHKPHELKIQISSQKIAYKSICLQSTQGKLVGKEENNNLRSNEILLFFSTNLMIGTRALAIT